MKRTMRAAFAALGIASVMLAISTITSLAADDTRALVTAMHPRTGKILMTNGLVELNLGPGFKYLDSNDSRTMITKVLGNPPSAAEGVQGMIFPNGEGEKWFAVLSYSSDGHVSDDDATKINYDDLLKQMKESTVEDSKERRGAGYAGLELLGWAQKPTYDAALKKLFWAKSIRFDDEPDPVLNYDVRVLGRTGFLNIKIVDSMAQLGHINAKMPEILAMANFTPSNTYADYVAGTDHTAAYGIAGLVAGGVLAKAGFFKGLLLMALAFKKFIIIAVLGIVAACGNFFRNLLGRKSAE